MATEMDFCLLGPLAVRCGGAMITVLPGKQRVVLATLLLNAGRPVRLDDLAEALWTSAPPPSGAVAVQNYVMRLRRALGEVGRDRIITQPRGYLIRVDAGELDVSRFEVLLAATRAAAKDRSWDQAAMRAREALELWRGEPLADVDSDVLAAREVPRLTELRLQALEIRLDADLHQGRHAEVIGELRQLAGAHPLRERLHSLLMLALYRDGRQAEALAAYLQARQVLVEELGTEPGAGLRELHQQVLTGDPALELMDLAVPLTSSVKTTVLQELPAGIRQFVGRADELSALTGLLDRAHQDGPGMVVISAIGGTAGVGKTALAVHWAHQVADRFPDGQLHVNLRGYDPDRPTAAADALAGFLRALGVPGHDIPPEESERAARYRSLLAGKRMLVILDNAGSVEQIRPLLPGSSTCTVLVTSRDALAGLVARDGAVRLDLDLLRLPDAIGLLRALIGGRVDTDPRAAAVLAEQCSRLPLALRVAAELTAARPDAPIAHLVAELSDLQQRLDVLDAGGDPRTAVRTVFSWSYQHLDPAVARMFRLLGLHPGPSVTVAAAASLAGIPVAEASRQLAKLTSSHLVENHMGRFAFHDLLRAYATEQALAQDSDAQRRAATGRMLDYYLHAAWAADLLLHPHRDPITLAPPAPGTAAPGRLTDDAEALAWFEEERRVLLAAVVLAAETRFDNQAWQLAWTLADFLNECAHWKEWEAVQHVALAAACRLGDVGAQAHTRRFLGQAHSQLGAPDVACAHFSHALDLYRQLDDRVGQARVHLDFGHVLDSQARYPEDLAHSQQALALFQEVGHRAGQARALNAIGWCHIQLGNYGEGLICCQQAIDLHGDCGDRIGTACTWDSLGYAYHGLRQYTDAVRCFQQAFQLFCDGGDRYYQAVILTHLGDSHFAGGHDEAARTTWQQALDIFDDMSHPEGQQVRGKLQELDVAGAR